MMKYTRWRPTTTIMGPNDASGVVWALGWCIFFFFCIFLILADGIALDRIMHGQSVIGKTSM